MKPMQSLALTALFTAALAASSAASAQAPQAGAAPSQASGGPAHGPRWGVAAISLPRYPGADRQQLLAAPLIEARFGEHFFASTLQGVGADWRPAEGLNLSAALVLDPHWRRRKDMPASWAALDEVKFAAALRLAAEWQLERFTVQISSNSRLGTLVQGRQGAKDLKGGHSLQFDASYGLLATRSLALAVGVSAEAMDKRLGQALFGVSAVQAAAAQLRQHQVKAGLSSLGVFAQAMVPVDSDWTFSARLGLNSLRGDAGNSPLVQKKRQPVVALSISRAF
jgi:outer membrane protein